MCVCVCVCVYSFKGAMVSKVNGDLWDLRRPLVEDCELQLLGFDSVEGKQVFKLLCIQDVRQKW